MRALLRPPADRLRGRHAARHRPRRRQCCAKAVQPLVTPGPLPRPARGLLHLVGLLGRLPARCAGGRRAASTSARGRATTTSSTCGSPAPSRCLPRQGGDRVPAPRLEHHPRPGARAQLAAPGPERPAAPPARPARASGAAERGCATPGAQGEALVVRSPAASEVARTASAACAPAQRSPAARSRTLRPASIPRRASVRRPARGSAR